APTPPARATTSMSVPRHCEQAPSARDALQRMGSTVHEFDPGADHQVPHRARDYDLTGPGNRRHPRPDVHGDASYPVPHELDLPGVDAGPDFQAQWPEGIDDVLGAPNCSGGAIEAGQEPVARSVDLPAAEPLQRAMNDGVVTLQQLLPGPITERADLGRRTHDVGE